MNYNNRPTIIDTLQGIANAGLDSGTTITLSSDCTVENMRFREGGREYTIKDVRVSDPKYMRLDELVGAEELVKSLAEQGLNAIKDVALRDYKTKASKFEQELGIKPIPEEHELLKHLPPQ